MKNIITVQQTKSGYQVTGTYGSAAEEVLTSLGRIQADRIGKNLKGETDGRKWVMYSSDLAGARQTADIIGARLGIDPILKPELRDFEGTSLRDRWNRLKVFFDMIMNSGDENILIVSNGDPLGMLSSMFLGRDKAPADEDRVFSLPGGVSHLTEDTDGKRLVDRLSYMAYVL